MATISELLVKIIADTSGLDAGLKSATKSIGDVGTASQDANGKTSGLVGQFNSLKNTLVAAGVIAAVVGLGKAIADSVMQFGVAEMAVARLNAIASMRGLTTGAERVSKLADEIQALTGIDGDLVKQLGAELIAQGKTLEQTEEMIRAATELSAMTGGDLNTAVTQLTATYSGTAGRLSKIIPEFKELTEEQLKNGEAIDIILEKYGGLAATQTNLVIPATNRLKESLTDVKEEFGRAFAPAWIQFANGFTATLNAVLVPLNYIATHSFSRSLDELWEAITGVEGAGTRWEKAQIAANLALIETNRLVSESAQGLKDHQTQLASDAEGYKVLTDAMIESRKEYIEGLLARTLAGGAARTRYEEQLSLINKEIAARKKLAAVRTPEQVADQEIEIEKERVRVEQASVDAVNDRIKAEVRLKEIVSDGRAEIFAAIETYESKQVVLERRTLDKKLDGLVALRKGNLNAASSYQTAWANALDKVSARFEDWKDFASTMTESVAGAFGDVFVSMGEALATGESAWDSMAQVALSALAEVVKAIGYQLTALAAVHLIALDFVGAAVAISAATAAFIAGGLLQGWSQKYASGTDFAPGGRALVGENGPEIINVPRGSSIVPAHRTQETSKGGVVVNIYSPVALNPSQAASVFKQTARELSYVGAL